MDDLSDVVGGLPDRSLLVLDDDGRCAPAWGGRWRAAASSHRLVGTVAEALSAVKASAAGLRRAGHAPGGRQRAAGGRGDPERAPDARVIMLTGYGAIATAVAAIKAGAVDYLPKPADADDVVRALLARHDESPAPPENPMSADRVRWEHIQRVYELCGHNVSETARRLNMHRRTLQRILAKRAPR